jgi:glutamyl-tRNA synthetase
MNTPGQQALWRALGFGQLPKYAHMSVTISQGGGKLSKRERPKTLRQAIGQNNNIDLEQLAEAGGINIEQLKDFIDGKNTLDMPIVDAMADYLGVHLPEINIVDFFKSGYLPETMINFVALLGWSPGGDKEIMTKEELIECFDLSRLTKSNSLFDRKKLLAFNTEHIKITDDKKLLEHFKNYLQAVDSLLLKTDDKLLARFLEINQGARTLTEIDEKCRFLLVENDNLEYDKKSIEKVLLKNNGQGLDMLKIVRRRLTEMKEFTEQQIEDMLRGLAEEKQVGLGKVAQPLRVAISGSTISPPIFDSVQILGMDNTLARIDVTLEKFTQA